MGTIGAIGVRNAIIDFCTRAVGAAGAAGVAGAWTDAFGAAGSRCGDSAAVTVAVVDACGDSAAVGVIAVDATVNAAGSRW